MRSALAAVRRKPFTAAQWCWGLLAAPTMILAVLFGFGPVAGPLLTVFISAGLAAAASADKLLRCAEAADARPADAAQKWSVRVADPAPGQCPVCGMDGLDKLAAMDDRLEVAGELRAVVPYGAHRAHWDCAWLVPPPAPKTRPATFLEPPYAEPAGGPRRRGLARVIEDSPAGIRLLRLERKVPSGVYAVCDADERGWHGGREFLIRIVSCELEVMPVSVFGYLARLERPLLHPVTAQHAVRSAALYPSPGMTWAGSAGRFVGWCAWCGETMNFECESADEAAGLADRHRWFECPAAELASAVVDERLLALYSVPPPLVSPV